MVVHTVPAFAGLRTAALTSLTGGDPVAGPLLFIGVGVALGTASGLVPGVHANSFALLLAAFAPSIPGPPRFVAATMLAAGVTHTFLDVVPALALGVPDPAMAHTALPGHRLVIEGQGREALRLSALGSGLAVALAVPLSVPVTVTMRRLYPFVRPHLPLVLLAVVAFLVLTEPSRRTMVAGLASFLASATLGLALLDRSPVGVLPVGDLLAPLFAGLFGAPVLLAAMGTSGVPNQTAPTVTESAPTVAGTAFLGAMAGAIVGFLPGVSSAIAAVVALWVVPLKTSARRFVVVTSGINTSNAIFALFALVTLGTPRSGVLVAVDRAGLPVVLPLLLSTVVIAASAGFVLVPLLGDRYLRTVGRMNYTAISVGVLVALVVLSGAFAGWLGVVSFAVATAVGMVPPQFGTRRVHLMGVLIGPIALAL